MMMSCGAIRSVILSKVSVINIRTTSVTRPPVLEFFSTSSTSAALPSLRRNTLLVDPHPCRPFIGSAMSTANQPRRRGFVFSRFHREKEWHAGPERFMPTATVQEKEAWLESLLARNEDVADVQSFLVVLRALASPEAVHDAAAPRRAEMWMNRLRNLDRHRRSHDREYGNPRHPTSSTTGNAQPTAECYQHVIQAWANSEREQLMVIVNRSERWLNELVEQSETVTNQFEDRSNHDGRGVVAQPTIHCFNAFLDACTRGRTGGNKKNQSLVAENAKRADAILRRLNSQSHHSIGQTQVVPNTDTFNFVIRGWTRCKHDDTIGWRVLALVRLMESHQRDDPWNATARPNTKTYSMAMDALISVARLKARRLHSKREKVINGRVNYRFGEAYTRHEDSSASGDDDKETNGLKEIDEAEAILNYMHDLHNAGAEGVVPHTVPYNILITGWAGLAAFGHDNAQFKAEDILRTMISHRDNGFLEAAPDRVSYEKVITAWSNSAHPNSGKRATWWLKQLWRESEVLSTSDDNRLVPTVSTYNVAMKALAKTDGALAAENMLLDLGEKYRDEGKDSLCPNSESFAVVIRAWLKASDESRNTEDRISSLRRAVEWLSSLREIENENNLSTAPELFSGVLKSAVVCARERPAVLDLAQEIFEDFRRSRNRVDHISYAALLQVGLQTYAKCIDSENKRRFVGKLFDECCDDGLLSSTFVRAVYDDHSEECNDLIERFFRQWPLPLSWSRNVNNPIAKPKRWDAQSSYERSSTVHRKQTKS